MLYHIYETAGVVEQTEQLFNWLLQQGWVGVVVLILLAQLGYLVKLLARRDSEIQEINEDRVKDSKEHTEKMLDVIVSLQAQIQVLTELVRALGGRR